MNADLPSLLCRFVSADQAGQMFASIFTTMCNYNTEMCGMALSQTVVPVYTIPNTYPAVSMGEHLPDHSRDSLALWQ